MRAFSNNTVLEMRNWCSSQILRALLLVIGISAVASLQSPSTRRQLLASSGPAVFLTTSQLLSSPAHAAPPITRNEAADSMGAKAMRLFRSKPTKSLLRPKLNKDFAVLLMRSSYNSLDQLDCVPMDQFQRDFFIIRQAEYEYYVNALGPGMMSQGDLTDPYYFDFISFAQYLAVNREITVDPPFVFEEMQPIQTASEQNDDDSQLQRFVTKVVRRDPALTNDKLAPEHERLVGDAILTKLEETFGETPSRIPIAAARPGMGSVDTDAVLAALNQLVKLFLLNGFAWDGSVILESRKGSVATFSLTLTAPATLWGAQALQAQRVKVSNTFLLKTANALVKRMGYRVDSVSVKYDGSREVSFITIS